jgi:hypothetical protein
MTVTSTARCPVTPMPNLTSAGRSPRELFVEAGATSGKTFWGGGIGTSRETGTLAAWAICASASATRLCRRSILFFWQHTAWSPIGSDGSSQSGQGIADAAKGTPRCQRRSAATSAALNHSPTACEGGGADQAQLIDLDKHVNLHASRRGRADNSDDSSLRATEWFQNRCDIQSFGGSKWSGSSTFMPAMNSWSVVGTSASKGRRSQRAVNMDVETRSKSGCIWSSVRARDIAKKKEATKAPSRIDSQDDMPSPPYLRGRRACVEACPDKGTPVMASKASACIASKFGATVYKASRRAQCST